jgi:hypothetical protein
VSKIGASTVHANEVGLIELGGRTGRMCHGRNPDVFRDQVASRLRLSGQPRPSVDVEPIGGLRRNLGPAPRQLNRRPWRSVHV